MAEWYFFAYTHHIFCIYTSADGHLGCFRLSAVVNRAAINTGVHGSFWMMVSLFLEGGELQDTRSRTLSAVFLVLLYCIWLDHLICLWQVFREHCVSTQPSCLICTEFTQNFSKSRFLHDKTISYGWLINSYRVLRTSHVLGAKPDTWRILI